MIAIILQATWRLGRSAVKSVSVALVGIAAIAAYAYGMNEIAILGAAAVAMAALHGARRLRISGGGLRVFSAGLLPGLAVSAAPTTAAAASAFALGGPFLVFLKIGTVLFGSGYVLVAVLATVGIFLPALVFVAASGPLVPRIRQSPLAGTMLDGIVIAPLALMAGAALLLFWFLVNPARREDSWTGADERQCWTDTASRAQRLVRRISEDRRQPAGRPPGGARFHRSVPGRAARLPSSAPGGRDGCGDHGLLPRLRVFARLALIITVMPSFLFSGFMFPISSMARPVQWYSYVSPPGTSWTSAGASSSRGWARYGLVPGEDERLYLKGPLPPAD